MRRLSDTFMENLLQGHLNPLLLKVKSDRDLVLDIRDNYLNIYFKGQSLLKLTENEIKAAYDVGIHEKFAQNISELPDNLGNEGDVAMFVRKIPNIKDRITEVTKSGSEVEFEQMLIRSNNYEPRLNTEYFIVDRQYSGVGAKEQFDLLGLFWPRANRRKNRMVDLAMIEVKYGLNPDVSEIHNQLSRYFTEIDNHFSDVCKDVHSIFMQKLKLGLFEDTSERLAAMHQFHIRDEINNMKVVVALVDYNPHSEKLASAARGLRELPFSDQIELFFLGFGLWKVDSKSVERLEG